MKRWYMWLVLFPLLLLLFLYLQRSGRQSPELQIKQAIPKAWKRHTDLIIAIAVHETGKWKSRAFLNCNNAFGIKTKTNTKCSAPIKEGAPYFYKEYESVSDSVRDFINWLERRNINPVLSSEQILDEMKRWGYYQDEMYKQKVMRWMKRN